MRRDLTKDDAHSLGVCIDTNNFAHSFDRFDVVHDHGEAKVDERANRQWGLGFDEDSGARNVGHVLVEECIERAEVCMELMGRKAEVPPFVMECAMLVNDLENLDFESHDIEATLTSLMSELQVEPYEDEPF